MTDSGVAWAGVANKILAGQELSETEKYQVQEQLFKIENTESYADIKKSQWNDTRYARVPGLVDAITSLEQAYQGEVLDEFQRTKLRLDLKDLAICALSGDSLEAYGNETPVPQFQGRGGLYIGPQDKAIAAEWKKKTNKPGYWNVDISEE